jgi:hypothetical protein
VLHTPLSTMSVLAPLSVLQLALLPASPLLHARGSHGPAAAWLRMAEGAPGGGNPIHRPSVDEKTAPKEPVSELGAWYKLSGSAYAEESRQYRRTVYMHDEWVKHRSSERFLKNLRTINQSGVSSALGMELGFITATAVFCVLANMMFHGYQDFSGALQPSPLAGVPVLNTIKSLSLPAFTFSIGMPALSLLLVFRTNTAYFRWNEARTLWGGVINSCRNVVRQANTYFPEDPKSEALKDVLAVNTAAFAKALRNFLRGPTDDKIFRNELMDIVKTGKMSEAQVGHARARTRWPFVCCVDHRHCFSFPLRPSVQGLAFCFPLRPLAQGLYCCFLLAPPAQCAGRIAFSTVGISASVPNSAAARAPPEAATGPIVPASAL